MAQEVRETLISRRIDCLAVPLPPSVEEPVERAVNKLPRISLVVAREPETDNTPVVNFVPVDPCQAVIMGIRVAMGEGIPRAYVDRETASFEPVAFAAPDPYALKRVPLASFASALLPALPAPEEGQRRERIAWMAFRLHELELDYESILFLCPLPDWPWLRDAYRERAPYRAPDCVTAVPSIHPVLPATLYFVLGELPFITELYERRRAEVRSDRHLAVDGIKELLLTARTHWLAARRSDSHTVVNWVTPHLLQLFLRYARNLALLERRLTPDLYTLVLAAKQMAGDEFAIMLLETAKAYAFQPDEEHEDGRSVAAGIGKVEFPDGSVALAKNRLQGPSLHWRSLSLQPTPPRLKSRRWALQWNPFRQCSWPPEDCRIESFARHVREQARAILGTDLARVEKFTSSVKDGVDIRETLRNWHGGVRAGGPRAAAPSRQADRPSRMDIYVKEIPPARGNVEVVIFLFETPADPDVYSWQATWYAEHAEESTLCFYASPYREEMVGPGIGQSRYGGAFFLFPSRHIPDIWRDPRLAFARTLEERLIAAGALHSQEPHIVLVSPVPPPARWRSIVRQFNRRLVTIPLTRFSGQTVDRLRRFHVLNGHEIRSYAARFIRQ
jgi:hypothetical protein